MGSKLVGLLICCGVAFGQSGSTGSIYRTLFLNQSATTTVAVPNIGQIGHQVTLQIFSISTNSCTGIHTALIQGELEYSYDNVTWSSFGLPLSSQQQVGAAGATVSYIGSGIYPYVRFNLSGFGNSLYCKVNGYYSGNTFSTLITSVEGAIPNGYNASNVAPVLIAGKGSGNTFGQIVACDSFVSPPYNTTLGGTATQMIGGATILGVCQMTISTSAAATVSILSSSGGCSSGNAVIVGPLYMAANQTLQLGTGLGTLFSFGVGNTFTLCLTSVGTGNITVGMTYIN